ncbi:MAG TPA: response regulator transcription factor [Actinomycetota bacterium]|jgi:two-component system, OmpR family, response regulator MtrA|nr:response regulator transcription factor [Actinomycetota bacterium]
MTRAHILVVSDAPNASPRLAEALRRAGFSVGVIRPAGDVAQEVAGSAIDLVCLDAVGDSAERLDLCRRISELSDVPLLVAGASDDPLEVVMCLDAGADEYLRPSIDPFEAVARTRALLRRARRASGRLYVGNLMIDPNAYKVFKDGREITLSKTEFRLLLELATRPGQVFTRDILVERVWDAEYLGDSRLVDMAVKRLRQKVEDDPRRPRIIRTVRGFGYRLDPFTDETDEAAG